MTEKSHVWDSTCNLMRRIFLYLIYSHLQGCYEKLEHEFISNLAYIGGTALGLAVILVRFRDVNEYSRLFFFCIVYFS
jgi:hypothetical protein